MSAAPFGITGMGLAVPQERVTLAALARATGASQERLSGKLGFEAKHQPPGGGDIAPVHLMAEASRNALRDAGARVGDLDLLLTVGRTRLDYLCFANSLAVLKELGTPPGVEGPAGLDFADYTGGPVLTGLRALAAKFAVDLRRKAALLVAVHRFSDLVDPRAGKDDRLWPTGDGACAMVVRRGAPGPAVLGHAFASEGKASALLALRRETVDEGPDPTSWYDHEWAQAKYLTLRDPERWFADFRERCQRRLPEVVERAVRASGLPMEQVARVQAGFLYPEVEQDARERLGIGARFQRHNAHGILGGVELGFALHEMMREPGLRGKAVVLCHAGTPADFGAVVLRL